MIWGPCGVRSAESTRRFCSTNCNVSNNHSRGAKLIAASSEPTEHVIRLVRLYTNIEIEAMPSFFKRHELRPSSSGHVSGTATRAYIQTFGPVLC